MEFKDNDLFDLELTQKISALTAGAIIIITVALSILMNLGSSNFLRIVLTGTFTGIFTLIYYSFPRLYTNRKLLILPDIVYTVAISMVILSFAEFGFFYFIFYLMIVVNRAFTASTKRLFFCILILCTAVITTNYLQIGKHHIMDFPAFTIISIFEIFWIVSISVILRIFAKNAMDLKKKESVLKQTLETIQKEKQEILTLFNTLTDVILSIDKKNHLTFANNKAFSFLSLKPEIIGKDISGLKYKHADKINSLKELLIGKKIYKNDIKIKCVEGFKRVNLTVTPIYDNKENYEGSIVYLHTLTEEEELEKTKVEFASIASHELRTPLAVIEGYAHLLLTNEKVKKDVEISSYLKTIHATCEDLINLSNNILTITKLESKSIRPTRLETNLSEILEAVASTYAEKAAEKNIKIIVSGQEPPPINTDASKVKEILNNLVDNAIKFTSKGTITIETTKERGEVTISVIDTGIGIKKESQSKIFTKFFRAEDWKTRETAGTGLGLFISKSLANLIGATLTLQSQEDLGSKFSLILPITKEGEK